MPVGGWNADDYWKLLRSMAEHEVHHRGELYAYLGVLGVVCRRSTALPQNNCGRSRGVQTTQETQAGAQSRGKRAGETIARVEQG